MLAWWRQISRFGKIGGVVGALSGAVVGVAGAWPFLEPYMVAHRGYVIDRTREDITPLKQMVIEIQIDRNHDRRERLLGEVEKRELELQSEQAKALPQYRELVQQRVDRVKKELKTLDDDDSNLFKQKLAK
jgi:hypothetical protein